MIDQTDLIIPYIKFITYKISFKFIPVYYYMLLYYIIFKYISYIQQLSFYNIWGGVIDERRKK